MVPQGPRASLRPNRQGGRNGKKLGLVILVRILGPSAFAVGSQAENHVWKQAASFLQPCSVYASPVRKVVCRQNKGELPKSK